MFASEVLYISIMYIIYVLYRYDLLTQMKFDFILIKTKMSWKLNVISTVHVTCTFFFKLL